MENSKNISLNVILFKSDNFWVAQCLEYDIVSQGSDIHLTIDRLGQTLKAQISYDISNKREPFSLIPKAADKYWNVFQRGVTISSELSRKFKDSENLMLAEARVF